MPITDTKPFNAYTGNGSTTQFAYQFYLLDKDDLAVMVDGAKRPASDYTITGVGNNGGGNVTFKSAPADKARVLIQRQTALKRDTDYALNGDMIAPTVNADFDRLWALGQELADESGRALVRPPAGVDYSAAGHQITDLGEPKTPQSAANKAYVDKEVLTVVTDIVQKATEQANLASGSAGSASTAAGQAAGSASAASTSAQNAARSEGNAATSATNAAESARQAAASASTASNAASAANQSAGQAQGFSTGAQTAATGAGSARDAANTAAGQAQTQAGNAADSARQAAGSATTAGQNATAAGQQADRAKTEADRAQTANPDNQLKKAQNLADLPDKLAARFNMGLGSFVQNATATGMQSPDAHNGFSVDNSGDWGTNDVHGIPIPLAVRRGGTGASDAATARRNLGVQNILSVVSTEPTDFNAFASPDNSKQIVLTNAGLWGVQDPSTGDVVPLPVGRGGTGHLATLNNLTGSIDDIAETGEGCIVGTSNGGVWPCPTITTEWAFIKTQVHADPNYRSQTLRYFVNNLQYRRERGTGGWGGWERDMSYDANNRVNLPANAGAFIKAAQSVALTVSGGDHGGGYLPFIGGTGRNNSGFQGGVTYGEFVNQVVNTWPWPAFSVQMDDSASKAISWQFPHAPSGVGDTDASVTGAAITVANAANGLGKTVAWAPTSDKRLKKDIEDWDGESGLANIEALELKTFRFINDAKRRLRRGIIAQQAERVDAEYVRVIKTQNADGEDVETLTLDTTPLLLDALAAIKVLSARVKTLEGTAAEVQQPREGEAGNVPNEG